MPNTCRILPTNFMLVAIRAALIAKVVANAARELESRRAPRMITGGTPNTHAVGDNLWTLFKTAALQRRHLTRVLRE